MNLSNLAVVSSLVLGLSIATGCANKTDAPPALTDGTTGTAQDQLVADNDEVSQADDDLEGGIDEPLSGADPSDPEAAPADAASEADLMDKVRTNPGRFFRPAGCLTTTVDGDKATHVFADCTGPYGMVHFNGTVVSTYSLAGGKLTITHDATDFHLNGATVSGSRVVTYSRSGSVITKTRTGSWTGTTRKGHPISHAASFDATYDVATKCVTRDGSASTTIGGRELDVSIAGYERCGIGSLGCPESGEIVLSRTKQGDTASVTIDFLGGRKYTVTGPKGNTVTLGLVCREN
jgi:hypothetical protein